MRDDGFFGLFMGLICGYVVCIMLNQQSAKDDTSALVAVAPSPLRATFDAICIVESGGDATAFKAAENAAGIAQITPIMVRDVNRILGEQRYTLADRYDPARSWEMFSVFCLHYAPEGDAETWARMWNSGPDMRGTDGYWAKVKARMSK